MRPKIDSSLVCFEKCAPKSDAGALFYRRARASPWPQPLTQLSVTLVNPPRTHVRIFSNVDKMANKVKKLPFWDTSWTPCKLNSDSCLNLEKITSSFSAPITEEHAWAIVFECVKCLKGIFVEQKHTGPVFLVTNTEQIYLHREGRVHESTFLNDHESKLLFWNRITAIFCD